MATTPKTINNHTQQPNKTHTQYFTLAQSRPTLQWIQSEFFLANNVIVTLAAINIHTDMTSISWSGSCKRKKRVVLLVLLQIHSTGLQYISIIVDPWSLNCIWKIENDSCFSPLVLKVCAGFCPSSYHLIQLMVLFIKWLCCWPWNKNPANTHGIPTGPRGNIDQSKRAIFFYQKHAEGVSTRNQTRSELVH